MEDMGIELRWCYFIQDIYQNFESHAQNILNKFLSTRGFEPRTFSSVREHITKLSHGRYDWYFYFQMTVEWSQPQSRIRLL